MSIIDWKTCDVVEMLIIVDGEENESEGELND